MRSLLLAMGVLAALPGVAEIIGWRTNGSGKYPLADPPTAWSNTENVAWAAELPARSNAIPLVVGNRVFVCSDPASLLCLAADSGELLWRHDLSYQEVEMPQPPSDANPDELRAKIAAEQTELDDVDKRWKESGRKDQELGARFKELRKSLESQRTALAQLDVYQLPKTHNDNGHSSPTPVCDGQRIYVLSGIGVVACFDLEGTRLWARFVEKPTHDWGHSASPILSGDLLIVAIVGLHALNAATGEPAWQVKAHISWGSPTATKIGDEDIIILPKGGIVLRSRDGSRLAAGLGELEYGTPVVQDGVVYFIEGKATAVKLPETIGDEFEAKTLWQQKIKGSRHYASPVIHDGLIYTVSREGNFTILDQVTGEPLDERQLDFVKGTNSAYPSVALAGKYLYLGCQEGTMVVLEPGRTYNEIARNQTEGFRSTPVFAGNRMYLRTFSHLYCFSK